MENFELLASLCCRAGQFKDDWSETPITGFSRDEGPNVITETELYTLRESRFH